MTIQIDNEGFALESGYITVYVIDELGIYSHSESQFVSVGCGVAANAVLDAPKPAKTGFAVQRVGNGWQYVADHRGKTVYHTKDRTALTINEVGEIPKDYTLLEPINHYCEWNGAKWVVSPEQQQAVISAEKSAKLAEINQKAQAFVNKLAKYDETPPFERDTWLEQAKEARVWFADKSAPTPTLDLIAQMRGVPQDLLRQKAYEKAEAYQQVAAIVAGQRQAYEDRLNAAETLEQVQGIEPVYQLQ